MPSFRFVLEFHAETNDDARDFGNMLTDIADSINGAFTKLKIDSGRGEVQIHQLNEWALLRRS